MRQWDKYDCQKYPLAITIADEAVNTIIDQNASYHRTCYQEVTNKTHLERAKQRFEKAEVAGMDGESIKKKRQTFEENLPECTIGSYKGTIRIF